MNAPFHGHGTPPFHGHGTPFMAMELPLPWPWNSFMAMELPPFMAMELLPFMAMELPKRSQSISVVLWGLLGEVQSGAGHVASLRWHTREWTLQYSHISL